MRWHAELYGGTLLLTKAAGNWKPVWYKAGVITRHCRRVSLESGRQILFCEQPDGGMGHSIHGLYSVNFRNSKLTWDSVVLIADSYSSSMLGGVQVQSIDRVSFDVTPQSGLSGPTPGESLPKPKVSSYEVDFRPDGEMFKATSGTAPSAKLFGVRSR